MNEIGIEDVTFYVWWILPAALVFGLAWLIVRIGRRKEWFKIKKIQSLGPCPFCGKAMTELDCKKMPSLTDMPREYTLGNFGKFLHHWEICETDIFGCSVCATKAWDRCRLKKEEVHTMQAKQKLALMTELFDFQQDLLMSEKERRAKEKNGG